MLAQNFAISTASSVAVHSKHFLRVFGLREQDRWSIISHRAPHPHLFRCYFVEVTPLNEIGITSTDLGPKMIQGFPGGPREIRFCREMATWWWIMRWRRTALYNEVSTYFMYIFLLNQITPRKLDQSRNKKASQFKHPKTVHNCKSNGTSPITATARWES